MGDGSTATELAVPTGDTAAFVHPALFYRTLDAYVAGVGGFVRGALEAEEPVFVAVPGDHLAALRDSLGDTAGGVDFADMTQLGVNPGRILSALQGFADQHEGRPARIVGEPIWPARTHTEILEATRHEALINTAFAGRAATILCPYDVIGLPEAVVRDARRTHPTLIVDGRDLPSPAYTDPAIVCADCDEPLPEPADASSLSYAQGQLGLVREHVEQWSTGTRLDRARRNDLVLAISEATANSIAHGGGSGTLRLWTTQTGTAIAEVSDNGHLRNPLAGRRRPSITSADGGRGLWMIHHLCDLVEIRATETGLTLRLHITP
ncbi:anti-sigma factor RsbA family regulatory protein [Streptomyces sp. 549]|uniref:anti-sigma factor RsbA family regulatory protein n=1 Tax=Streptomyces sp. 549 TaxID=3049076 RepID=UPI0024C41CAE|nr:anti-sigma factor RsbA family regulatory protein [Streptomyces sp. 549]MDK1477003.1 anti-sigma factor RsbA family regulatory protein [Streptomyces sp. 549]